MRAKRSTQSHAKSIREKWPAKRIWRVTRPIIASVVVFAVIFGFGFTKINSMISESLSPVDAYDDTPIPIEIARGSSVTKICNILEQNGIVRDATLFKYYIEFVGKSNSLNAGKYFFYKSMSMDEVIEQLARGDGRAVVTEFLIKEGSTVEDIAAILKSNGVLGDTKRFLELCRTGKGLERYDFIEYKMNDEEETSPYQYIAEGYLFPAKYEVYIDSTEEVILRKMIDKYCDVYFTDEYMRRAEALNLTDDEVLILASMIEKEAKTKDFYKVSAVFHNRLKRGMKLESDPTIKYVLGIKRFKLTDEELAYKSPYNTYDIKGLPVGSICNPGKSAIEAALYPDEEYLRENYLYFCSKEPESGELAFAKTEAQHRINVSEYEQSWIDYDQNH